MSDKDGKDRSPSIMACELFGYAFNLFPLKTSEGKGQSFINCSPRPRGQGSRHGLEWAPSPQRVSPRGTPEEIVGQFLQRIEFILPQKGSIWCIAETTFVQSSGVPRVGLLASRAMAGAPL